MNYYSFDEELLIAVIWRESKFKVNVVGKNNDKTMDYGLCQLNSKYHNLKPKDLLKIKTNVELGAKHLDWCIKKSKGNLERALNFYHCGYGNVMNRGWHNNEYVKDITNYANMLRLSYFNYRSNN